ncbi:hypothetical protein M406DRAFT_106463 [Cryphonectria parasitica EP155]|uniref:Uncharacterized protein n=1 Tax=Cryphonectria parasitica (strain ATCC 38755 / EP155) TaxID=660469 RepID=A0A9P5CR39_CRYP1|nr:uncharacterized protein M406DRAFT_106463 [Cryphonectria parasitica EP155]KAF3767132.1 hypothetical protein M406DRAFT_106463 [Cryphonectria parasitica EP155]
MAEEPDASLSEMEGIQSNDGTENDSSKWMWGDLPPEDDPAFQEFLRVSGNFTPTTRKPPSLEDLENCCGIWPVPPEKGFSNHASFGQDGTTASVSRSGDIVQITRFLGAGKSGIFSMDHKDVSQPYLVVSRAAELEKLSFAPTNIYSFGITLDFDVWPAPESRSVKWVNWKWPRYEWQTNGMKIIFQYMVRDGVVLHQLLFKNLTSGLKDLWELRIDGKPYIRDLDYLRYNSDDSSNVHGSGPHQYGRVTVKESMEYQVAAVLNVFVDGKRAKLDEHGYYNLQTLSAAGGDGNSHIREIVLAYKLSYHPKKKPFCWKDSMIPAEQVDVNQFLEEETREGYKKTMDPGLFKDVLDLHNLAPATQDKDQTSQEKSTIVARSNMETCSQAEPRSTSPGGSHTEPTWAERIGKIGYLTWRHLEHILSVCAIPFSPSPALTLSEGQNTSDAHDTPSLVALTCGDMSGHRISTSASFYSFTFLIHIEDRLKKYGGNEEYISQLRARIKDTCDGHIRWLEHLFEHPGERHCNSGCFAANYWVTGCEMPLDSTTWQPDNAVTDTAFQILKITEYISTFCNDNPPKEVESLLTKLFVSWLHTLERLDPRARFAWPHNKEDGVNKFRLEDNLWIWKALQAMDKRKMYSQLPFFRTVTGKRDKQRRETVSEENKKMNRFLDLVGQKEDFRKISLSADPERSSEKTFEELYERFYLIQKRLAPSDVLRGILQRFTIMNDVLGKRMLAQLWDDTVNSQPYHPDNEEYSSKWLSIMRYALSIMMGSQDKSLNSKKPTDAQRDSVDTLLRFFGHNGFLGGQLGEQTRQPVLFDAVEDRDPYYHASFEILYVLLIYAERLGLEPGMKKSAGREQDSEISDVLQHDQGFSSYFAERPKIQKELQRNWINSVLKESMPFNNLIDTSNICSIDEEWLLNYPEFLSGLKVNFEDVEQREAADINTWITDAKKQKQYGKPRKLNREPWDESPVQHCTNQRLEEILGSPRTARSSKKRFIWLHNANSVAKSLCQAATAPELEKQAMVVFFDRHLQDEAIVWDDTTFALNTWQTEVHLNFHLLCEEHLPTSLCRASMSYRFHGDLVDRHWTCHFIESKSCDGMVQDPTSEFLRDDIFDSYEKSRDNFKEWWQRKILEILLLHRILDKFLTSTDDILNKMEKISQANENTGFRIPTEKTKLPSHVLRLHDVDILEKVENDLTSTLESLERWNNREKDRGQEKPRWTLNDERKYRKRIRELQRLIGQDHSHLRKQREEVLKLQKRLEHKKEKRRIERNSHSERNIRWFTYITIVFAPLSFAEGFYSMNGAPSHPLIASLAKFSFAALTVTGMMIVVVINIVPILKIWKNSFLEYDDKMDGKSLDKLADSVLKPLARGISYSVSLQGHGALSGKVVIRYTFRLVFGAILVLLFIISWLTLCFVLTAQDLYLFFRSKWSRSPPSTKHEETESVEGAQGTTARSSIVTFQPRLLKFLHNGSKQQDHATSKETADQSRNQTPAGMV